MQKVKVVSGYIPIPGILNVTESGFREYGARLKKACPCPTEFFDMTTPVALRHTWMARWLSQQPWGNEVQSSDPAPDPARFAAPGIKLLSNFVMHQKYEWLALAAINDPVPDVFVWLDYGVLKQSDMTELVVTDFLQRLERKSVVDEIIAPGVRAIKVEPVPSESWDRFCGSVVIVPRRLVFDLARAMKLDAMEHRRADKESHHRDEHSRSRRTPQPVAVPVVSVVVGRLDVLQLPLRCSLPSEPILLCGPSPRGHRKVAATGVFHMADKWEKGGDGSDNVKSGPGSKSGATGTPKVSAGGAGASATEKTHNVEFAKGGNTPMFGEQEAASRTGADKSPSTGKPDSSGPGEKFAQGGSGKMFGFSGALPAQSGITSAR